MSGYQVVRHRWVGDGFHGWTCTRRVPSLRNDQDDICHGCAFFIDYTSIATRDLGDVVNRPLAGRELALRLDLRAETIEPAAAIDWASSSVGRA